MKFKYYTDGQKTIKVKIGDTPPLGFYPGRTFKVNTWNKGLKAETDPRVRKNIENSLKTRSTRTYTPWNKGLTKEMDSRIKGMPGELNPMYNTHPVAWNKGLNKEMDARVRKISNSNIGKVAWNKGIHPSTTHKHSEETKEKIRAAHLDPDFKLQRYIIMKNNGTLFTSKSKAEESYYEYLKLIYAEDDIIRQYMDKDRYPYKCDFYIKSEDMFIEINANWTHGKHPFDSNSVEDLKILAEWEEKAKTSKFYQNAIYQWTDLDVRKLKCARDNNLNFKAIY